MHGLAGADGCRNPSGPGLGLGPDRVGCTERTSAAAHNPRHRTDSHPRRFIVQDGQIQRSDLAVRNPERGRPISCLGQPASGLETGQHRSTPRWHQAWNGSASQPQPETPRAGRTHQPNPSGMRHTRINPLTGPDGPPAGNLQKIAISGTLRHVEFTRETHRI